MQVEIFHLMSRDEFSKLQNTICRYATYADLCILLNMHVAEWTIDKFGLQRGCKPTFARNERLVFHSQVLGRFQILFIEIESSPNFSNVLYSMFRRAKLGSTFEK